MTLGSVRLLQQLGELPQPRAYWVGLSGGLDSVVLLHQLCTIRDRLGVGLHAIHCDHGLQSDSADWAQYCQALCDEWSVPCRVERLQISPQTGESLESLARQARYQAFAEVIGDQGMLLTAHHQDDQAETLLLQLLRGAGVAGLAAMPLIAPLERGWLARPLLSCGQADLEAYARDHALEWIDDPSNESLDFDRNFLRHRVMPLLQSRWPAAAASISRSAGLCAEVNQIVRSVAENDLARCRGVSHYRQDIRCLQNLPRERRASLLRAWVADVGLPPMPGRKLQQVFDDVIAARPDAAPLLSWEGAQLRRYRETLWLMPTLSEPVAGQCLAWSGIQPLPLPADLGQLGAVGAATGIDRSRFEQGHKEVRFRSEGLRCTPAGRQGSRPLKKLFQELGVPPWLRKRLPLLFIDGKLAAVGDYVVCGDFAAAPGEPAITLVWQRPDWLR